MNQTNRANRAVRAERNEFQKFIVVGEQHYWVHVAIDRFTGEVLDKQIEVVREY